MRYKRFVSNKKTATKGETKMIIAALVVGTIGLSLRLAASNGKWRFCDACNIYDYMCDPKNCDDEDCDHKTVIDYGKAGFFLMLTASVIYLFAILK